MAALLSPATSLTQGWLVISVPVFLGPQREQSAKTQLFLILPPWKSIAQDGEMLGSTEKNQERQTPRCSMYEHYPFRFYGASSV